MIVAGIMSGTSADGINVALVQLGWSRATGPRAFDSSNPTFKFIAQAEYPYPKAVRQAVLQAMNAAQISVADLARLNFLLAELYAEAVLATQRRFRLKVELIGCHGQTLYHQGEPAKFLGRKLAVTWQTGEGAVIAARTGVPVVSDFRPADMAAGGKGAPLVPFLDYLLYRDRRVGRIVQNIGGIANLTAIPAGASAKQVTAFDTGPGNMVIDAVTERLFGQPYDRDGRIAASGVVLERVVSRFCAGPFSAAGRPRPPGGRNSDASSPGNSSDAAEDAGKADVVATATALTARSIADALRRFVLSRRGNYREFVVSGGGANNPTLLAMLANELRPLHLTIRASDEFGLPSAAKEAAAFALMAFETWNHRPSNIPSATGARRPAILGKISYA